MTTTHPNIFQLTSLTPSIFWDALSEIHIHTGYCSMGALVCQEIIPPHIFTQAFFHAIPLRHSLRNALRHKPAKTIIQHYSIESAEPSQLGCILKWDQPPLLLSLTSEKRKKTRILSIIPFQTKTKKKPKTTSLILQKRIVLQLQQLQQHSPESF